MVPQDIVMHHANWTVDVAGKMAQLRVIRDIIEADRGISLFKCRFEYWVVKRSLAVVKEAKKSFRKWIKQSGLNRCAKDLKILLRLHK